MIFRLIKSSLLLVTLYLGKSTAEGGETKTSKAPILFAGDSDIEYWKKTNQEYPNSANRGVGGTTCKQWTRSIDKWLAKDQPSTVVLVCGENDLAYGYSPADAFSNFKKVVSKISAKGATTIYIGTKPEPATNDLHAKYRQYDALIRDYYGGKQEEPFVMIDVYPSFVNLDNPKSLYRNDKLHLSTKGYGYWNDWLKYALNDNSGCLRWETEKCALASNGDNDNDNESTLEPTSTSSCSDDPDFRFRGKELKDCDWVARKSRRRCEKRDQGYTLKEWCPKACGDC
jgi:lysophospholipase L1-like esterase